MKLNYFTYIIFILWFSFSVIAQENGNDLHDGIYIDDYGNVTSYKDGKLHGKQVKKKKYSTKEEIKYYDEGIIIKEEYNFFKIKNEQKPVGNYKNGKPYRGYFIKGSKDVLLVDYYEKGEKKYQYSKKNLFDDDYQNPLLNIKSTYKDGKIYNGSSYLLKNKNLEINNLKKGKIVSQTFWIFAMHYANFITISFNDNGFIMTEGRNPNLKLFSYKNILSIKDGKKKIIRTYLKKNSLANKRVIYYEENKILKKDIYDLNLESKLYEIDKNNIYNGSLLFKMYPILVNNKDYITKGFSDIESLFKNNSNKFNEHEWISFLQYNKKGKPITGMLILKKGTKFTGKMYKNGRLIRTLKRTNIDRLRTYFKEYLKKQ